MIFPLMVLLFSKYIIKNQFKAEDLLSHSYDNILREQDEVKFDIKNHHGKEVDIDAMFFTGTDENLKILGDEFHQEIDVSQIDLKIDNKNERANIGKKTSITS